MPKQPPCGPAELSHPPSPHFSHNKMRPPPNRLYVHTPLELNMAPPFGLSVGNFIDGIQVLGKVIAEFKRYIDKYEKSLRKSTTESKLGKTPRTFQ